MDSQLASSDCRFRSTGSSSDSASSIGNRQSAIGNAEPAPAAQPRRPARLWKTLRSIRFAILLMAALAIACTVGTLIRQEPYDPARLVGRYGRTLGSLVALLGLNQLYQTWWFLGLVALFAFSTIACSLSRVRLRLRSLGFALVHLSVLFIAAGVLLRGVLGVNGMLVIAEGDTAESFTVDGKDVPLGFPVRLDDFQVRRYEKATDLLLVLFEGQKAPTSLPVEVGKSIPLRPDGTAVEVLRYLPDFKIAGSRIYSASEKPNNPAIQVRITGPAGDSKRWLFAKMPDVHAHGSGPKGLHLRYIRDAPIRAFESHVTILNGEDQELRRAVIQVNTPLRVGRYTLFQSSYDVETEAASELEVVYDPGVPLVFLGFILMPLGMAFVFYIQPLLRRREHAHA